jgi:hypothetical protein
MTKATSGQIEAIRATTEALSRLADTTQAVLQHQETLQTAIRQLSEANLDKALIGVADQLQAQARETRSTGEAARDLSSTTREVLSAQMALQTAMQQLHDTGLQPTLAALGKSLENVGRVLERFRKPIVFQAVEVDAVPLGGNLTGMAATDSGGAA